MLGTQKGSVNVVVVVVFIILLFCIIENISVTVKEESQTNQTLTLAQLFKLGTKQDHGCP